MGCASPSTLAKDGDPLILVWQAETRTMNPTCHSRVIEEAMERDPASGRGIHGEFRCDIEAFIAREAVEACVALGVRQRTPVSGTELCRVCRSERRQRQLHDAGGRPPAG